MYDELMRAVKLYFDQVKVLKRSARGEITLLRHRETGKRYVFRHFMGSGDVYGRLLTVDCPHLPHIEEVGEMCIRDSIDPRRSRIAGDAIIRY